jgi:hypothetical protein
MQGEDIYGIDVVIENLQEAAQKGVKTCKVNVSQDRFPFSDCFFDVIIAST